MNLIELQQCLRTLRLSGISDVLEMRIMQAQTENLAAIDLLSLLVSDELTRRSDRLLQRRIKYAQFRDKGKSLRAPHEFSWFSRSGSGHIPRHIAQCP